MLQLHSPTGHHTGLRDAREGMGLTGNSFALQQLARKAVPPKAVVCIKPASKHMTWVSI